MMRLKTDTQTDTHIGELPLPDPILNSLETKLINKELSYLSVM